MENTNTYFKYFVVFGLDFSLTFVVSKCIDLVQHCSSIDLGFFTKIKDISMLKLLFHLLELTEIGCFILGILYS